MNIGYEMLYLSRADIEEINLPMAEIMDLLENAYIEKHGGRLDMPPKLGISPAGSICPCHAVLAAVHACRRLEMGGRNPGQQAQRAALSGRALHTE